MNKSVLSSRNKNYYTRYLLVVMFLNTLRSIDFLELLNVQGRFIVKPVSSVYFEAQYSRK